MEFALVHVVSDRATHNFPRWHNERRARPHARSVREWFGPHVNRAMTQLEDAWVAADLSQEDGVDASTSTPPSMEYFQVDLADESLLPQDPSRTFLDRISSAAVSVRDNLQPQGDVHNDDTVTQRALNILTSLPIIALGWNMRSKLSTSEGRSYANSVIAVGLAATAYHVSWGKLRTTTARKLDYYAISYSSAKMLRALWPGKATERMERAMHCITPFRPFWVSSVGALAMQAEFVRLGTKNEALRPALKRHLAAAVASGFAFATEDILAERAGFIGKHLHSLWHLTSTYGLWTIGELVEHKEQMRNLAAARSAGLYDSAASLKDLQYVSSGKGTV